MRPHITKVLETCLYVNDLEVAEKFYTEVLGLKFHKRQPGRHLFLRCGAQMVLLFDPQTTSKDGKTPHGAVGAGHIAFAAADEELLLWEKHLSELGIKIEDEVNWPGGGRSIYFRDPAGNSLEFATVRTWGLVDAP